MRSLSNDKGNVDMIITAVVAAIVIAISLVIVFSVMGGLDTDSVDANIQKNVYGEDNSSITNIQYAGNSSDSLLDNLDTFFTIAPIYVVVLAAVGIIGAVMMIMIKRK